MQRFFGDDISGIIIVDTRTQIASEGLVVQGMPLPSGMSPIRTLSRDERGEVVLAQTVMDLLIPSGSISLYNGKIDDFTTSHFIFT